MLRGVAAVVVAGLAFGAPASAAELITYPTLSRGTVAFAPAPFATLDIDWLAAFAVNGGAGQAFDAGFATVDTIEVTMKQFPPAASRQEYWPVPLD